MKTLYIYSDKTGLGRSNKKDKKIIEKLNKIFPNLNVLKTNSLSQFEKAILSTKNNYDNLIIAGGDGTLKFVVNCLMKFKKSERPTLGYIPAGTVNDAGKAFGCGSTIRSGIRNLRRKVTTNIDVVKVNDDYINFVIACGAFSDISYSTRRIGKKIVGRLAYYFDAIPKLFKKKIVKAEIIADGKKYKVVTPFILMMNSKNVGGFPVNFKYSINDGLLDLYITKPGLFNGLLHYLFFKMKTMHIKAHDITIKVKDDTQWCFDGEKGDQGSLNIRVLKNELNVFGVSK